jgi:hypothetical protein
MLAYLGSEIGHLRVEHSVIMQWHDAIYEVLKRGHRDVGYASVA